MKRLYLCLFIVLAALFIPVNKAAAQDPIAEIIKEGIIKVIKAVDLKIQRLQTKTIWLQNAQKALENTMSQLKLDQITGWVDKQKKLYENYFDELWKVKDVLTYYHKIKGITEIQLALVKEYKRAYNHLKNDPHFSAEEILYMGKVYTGIIEESLNNLDQVVLVIHSFTTQMSDAARMKIMDQAAEAITQNYSDLKSFTSQNMALSLVRSKDQAEIEVVKALYGIQ